jgi:hypothetical protein
VNFWPTSSEPRLFTHCELSDLVGDLALPKDCIEIFGSRLQSKNLLSLGTAFLWYQNRDRVFIPCCAYSGPRVYCSDISWLICKLDVVYHASEWILFIGSSKRSLKGVLLYSGKCICSCCTFHSLEGNV